MNKIVWPESLLLMQELKMFFRVKDVNFEQDDFVINEAGENVLTHFSIPKSKPATINNEDFTEIYEREIKKILKEIEGNQEDKRNIDIYDNPKNRKYWRGLIIDGVQNKINSYFELTKKDPPKERNHVLVCIADDFIKFLSDMDTQGTPKTLRANRTPEQLNRIRENLIDAKYIDKISEADFIYLFTEQPIIKNMKRIGWKESGAMGHEFLKRLVYGDEKFVFKQVNECIKYPKDKKLDSQSKSTAQYKNDSFNTILDV